VNRLGPENNVGVRNIPLPEGGLCREHEA